MDQENKKNNVAPSTDTTSALFVSARKRQIEEQEAQRLAREKEDERRRAEDEVRRLEAEVAERKRRAEEEALRVATEEKQRLEDEKKRREEQQKRLDEEQRRQAKEAAQAAQKSTVQSVVSQGGAAVKKALPLLPIIGGAVGLVAVIVLVVLLASGGSGKQPKAKPAQAKVSTQAPIETPQGADVPDYATLLMQQTGTWYLNGNMADIRFITDGASGWQIYDESLVLVVQGTFEVDNEAAITATYIDDDGDEMEASVTFNDENSFNLSDEVFYSEAFSAYPEGEDETDNFTPDASAELDSNAVVEALGMMIRYPSTVLEVNSLSEARLMLTSLDGATGIEVGKGDSYTKATQDDMDKYRDKKFEKLSGAFSSGVNLLDSGSFKTESNMPRVYFEFTYESDETRHVFFIAGLWKNERNGNNSYYDFILDCPESQLEEYQNIFSRMFSSTEDA